MALGWTHPQSEMSTPGISWGGGEDGRCLELAPTCADNLEIMGVSTFWSLSRLAYRYVYLYLYLVYSVHAVHSEHIGLVYVTFLY